MARPVLLLLGMRKPRFFRPNQIHDVSSRCHRAEFRLLPTEARTDRFVFALAKALQKFPSVHLLVVCQMSNHFHLCVLDCEGQLSEFMQAFLSPLAKSLNKLDKVRGSVFHRRFTAMPVLDDGSVIDLIAYAVTNPGAAGLVRTWKQWTGVVGWAGNFAPRTVTHFHEERFLKAREEAVASGGTVNREDFEETVTLSMPRIEGLDEEAILSAIDARQAAARRKHKRVVGMLKVVKCSPLHQPKWSKLSPMPLCLWTCRTARAAFVHEWYVFLKAFREASARFREGELGVGFPPHSHRPSIRV